MLETFLFKLLNRKTLSSSGVRIRRCVKFVQGDEGGEVEVREDLFLLL